MLEEHIAAQAELERTAQSTNAACTAGEAAYMHATDRVTDARKRQATCASNRDVALRDITNWQERAERAQREQQRRVEKENAARVVRERGALEKTEQARKKAEQSFWKSTAKAESELSTASFAVSDTQRRIDAATSLVPNATLHQQIYLW